MISLTNLKKRESGFLTVSSFPTATSRLDNAVVVTSERSELPMVIDLEYSIGDLICIKYRFQPQCDYGIVVDYGFGKGYYVFWFVYNEISYASKERICKL